VIRNVALIVVGGCVLLGGLFQPGWWGVLIAAIGALVMSVGIVGVQA
jgi:hypothetical protein